MNLALMLLGLVAEAVAWWWISGRGASVWSTMTPVLAAMGLAALLTGAVVGGAAWVALAEWSGGVLAPLVRHVGWTTLMLAFPPLEAPFPEVL